jgi:hypothetical protein
MQSFIRDAISACPGRPSLHLHPSVLGRHISQPQLSLVSVPGREQRLRRRSRGVKFLPVIGGYLADVLMRELGGALAGLWA